MRRSPSDVSARTLLQPSRRRACGVTRRVFVPRGFTLIELLVVVAIIVVLIAILIPALGHAKNRARESAARGLLSQLGSAIEAYHTDFQAYPGPMRSAVTTSAVAADKISGTQNLMLGLSYALLPAAGGSTIPVGTSGAHVDKTRITGPLDYATRDPSNNAKQYAPYFSANSKQLSTATFGAFSSFTLPVVVDTFPDGLPILYYRRSPGVERSVNNNVVETNPSIAVAPYYLDDNKDYTNATITATSGRTFNQTLGSFDTVPADLEALVATGSGATISARGGFIILSAGTDRIYGRNSGTNKMDDLYEVGGH